MVVMLVQFYFWLTFHHRRPIEMDSLYEATNVVLFIIGITLFIASLAMSISRPKSAAWGVIIAVLAILTGIISPLNVVRA